MLSSNALSFTIKHSRDNITHVTLFPFHELATGFAGFETLTFFSNFLLESRSFSNIVTLYITISSLFWQHPHKVSLDNTHTQSLQRHVADFEEEGLNDENGGTGGEKVEKLIPIEDVSSMAEMHKKLTMGDLMH